MKSTSWRPFGQLGVLRVFLLISALPVATAAGAQNARAAEPQARDARIAELLSIVIDRKLQDNDPERFEAAIAHLGELRAEKAIDLLVPLLDYKAHKYRRKDECFVTGSGESLYPVVDAVAQIGKPAVPAIVRALENREPESRWAINARGTLILIFREELGAGVDVLSAAARKSETADGASRLRAAADHLRKVQEELARPRP
ncbi:MAG: hypothetical protein L0387_43790 [Acidobacteria bacterium]|nr:hypothetical protein [Acidobacteriota bacterium]